MKSQKPYLTGVWVLAVIAFFLLLLFGLLDISIPGELITLSADDPILYLFLCIPLSVIEGYIYWRLRYRIQKKIWVRTHVWSFFIAAVIIPIIVIIIFLFINIIPGDTMGGILDYSFCGFLALGHIFFIATIVRNFTQKKK